MARVRNLIFNGTVVEQPIYNGTPLTKWIHDGVVVWEQGSSVVDVTLAQISVPSELKAEDFGFLTYDGNGTIYFGIQVEMVESPYYRTLKCYSAPLGGTASTLLWSLDDDTYFGDNNPWFFACYANSQAKGYLIKPWDFANKVLINGSVVVQIEPQSYADYFATNEIGNLQQNIRAKSNLLVSTTINNIPSGNVTVFGASNILSAVANGYTIYDNSGNIVGGNVFDRAMDHNPVYFNGYLIGTVTENGHFILVRCKVDSGTVETLLDITEEGYQGIYACDDNTYCVSYDGNYFVMSVMTSTDAAFIFVDTSFNIYKSSAFSTSLLGQHQMIENYIYIPSTKTAFRADFNAI